MVEDGSGGRTLPTGFVLLAAALTAAVLVLPGREGLEQRVALLLFPWGGLALGFGTLWLVRRPHLEDVVGRALVAVALLLGLGIVIGVAYG